MSKYKDLEKRVEELEELVQEISKEYIVHKVPDYSKINTLSWSGYNIPEKNAYDLTIQGKVKAIIDHLGISIEVVPEKTKTEPEHIKVTTISKRKYIKSGKYSKKGQK